MRININKKINLKNGQVMLLTAIFFMTFTVTICLGFIDPIVEQARISSHYWNINNNYYLSEAGIEDLIYRFKNKVTLDGNEIVFINGSRIPVYSSGDEGHKILTSEFGTDLDYQKIRVEAQRAGDKKFIILDWRSTTN